MLSQKLKEFNFKLLYNIAPCGYTLAKWNDKISAECVLCGQVETLGHMLYECHYISHICNMVSQGLKIHVQ